MRPRRFIPAALACLLAFTALPVVAQAKATFRVLPHQPKDGGPVRLDGSHLKPNSFYTLLLAIPDVRKPVVERLFGPVKTDSNGRLHVSIHLPAVTHCGPAFVYAYGGRTSPLRAAITLTTCSVKGGTIKLPPPPGGGKKKH